MNKYVKSIFRYLYNRDIKYTDSSLVQDTVYLVSKILDFQGLDYVFTANEGKVFCERLWDEFYINNRYFDYIPPDVEIEFSDTELLVLVKANNIISQIKPNEIKQYLATICYLHLALSNNVELETAEHVLLANKTTEDCIEFAKKTLTNLGIPVCLSETTK